MVEQELQKAEATWEHHKNNSGSRIHELKRIELQKLRNGRREYFEHNKIPLMYAAGYEPHPKQVEIHTCGYRFVIVVGGARFGKTYMGAGEAFIEFLIPGAKIWIVGPVYHLADKEFFKCLDYIAKFPFKNGTLIDYCRLSAPAKGGKRIESPWGSWIETKSTEKPTSLLGEELDKIIGAEWANVGLKVWNVMLEGRLISRDGRFFAASTGAGNHGAHATQYKWGLDKENPDYQDWISFKVKTSDNPTIDPASIEQARARMDAKAAAEQLDGEIISRSGNVFRVLPASLVKFEREESQPFYIGVYHKNNNVGCAVMLYKGALGYYVFDELLIEESPCKELAEKLKKYIQGKRFSGFINGYEEIATQTGFKESGLFPVSINESIYSKSQAENLRIQLIQNMLSPLSGLPRIFINPAKCPNLIKNLQECEWKDRSEKLNSLEPEIPKEAFLPMVRALSYPLSFLELSTGFNFYHSIQNSSTGHIFF